MGEKMFLNCYLYCYISTYCKTNFKYEPFLMEGPKYNIFFLTFPLSLPPSLVKENSHICSVAYLWY
jgi:hypothetical protein